MKKLNSSVRKESKNKSGKQKETPAKKVMPVYQKYVAKSDRVKGAAKEAKEMGRAGMVGSMMAANEMLSPSSGMMRNKPKNQRQKRKLVRQMGGK